MRTLEVEFELEALMLTGQCIDVAARTREQVPRHTQAPRLCGSPTAESTSTYCLDLLCLPCQ